MSDYDLKIGVVMNISKLGVTEEVIPGVAESTFILEGGYRKLTKDEVVSILQLSM